MTQQQQQTELSTLNPTSVQDIITVSNYFFESGMFTDVKSAAQAMVKIMAGAEMGLSPFFSMSGIHIISGKPTLGAGIMAAQVKRSGKYDYKVIKQDEKLCQIDFYQGKEKIGSSSFNIEEAKKAGTKNLDKFPANMLFARALSNGVRFYCPDIFAGPVYTPEEMQQETIDVHHQEIKPEPKAKAAPKQSQPATAPIELYDYTAELKLCATTEELSEVWNKIPKEQKATYLALKDQIKEDLTNETATT